MFVRWDNIPFVKIKQLCMGMAETSGKDATQMKFKDIDSTVKVRALRDGRTAEVELRFVSQPTLYAPSVVLRSQLKPIRDINQVGFLPRQIADLKAAYTQKRGILIVTGATGSGKTNTLERSTPHSKSRTFTRSSRSASRSRSVRRIARR
jgi:Tfp pilus assembly pilus retraction ATPase PilT